ncbi:MAG: substrate-binding domain-containing protein [Myxococcales bacterium]|nr:substrate-binding domain-containing protein [Myxococcales bacterium]
MFKESGWSSRFLTLVISLVLIVPMLLESEATAAGGSFSVIVNPVNPIESLSRKQLSDLIMKKVSKWENGQRAQPVDLTAGNPTRGRFSQAILGKSVGAMKAYWQQQIFSGRGVPPPELRSDADVIAFVASRQWAIGYVSQDADTSKVKVIKLRD